MVLEVYIDNGIKYSYELDNASKVREHTSAIIKTGYRHNDGKGVFIHWPPHRIDKVQCLDIIPTKYIDTETGT